MSGRLEYIVLSVIILRFQYNIIIIIIIIINTTTTTTIIVTTTTTKKVVFVFSFMRFMSGRLEYIVLSVIMLRFQYSIIIIIINITTTTIIVTTTTTTTTTATTNCNWVVTRWQ